MPDEAGGGCPSADDLHEREQVIAELPPAGLLALEDDLAARGPQSEPIQVRAGRLERDRRIVELLADENFEGPDYQKLAARLVQYGWPVIIKWTGTGEIFRKARLAGRPVPADMITTLWTPDDRREIATDSIIEGLKLFREYGLVRGRWRPDGGASLTTYFVGATIRTFRPVYKTWYRTRQIHQAELVTDVSHDTMPGEIPDQRALDPCSTAATHDAVARLLPFVTDAQALEGLVLRAAGYTQAEAAERAGLTEKALERRLSRIRVKITENRMWKLELGEGGAR